MAGEIKQWGIRYRAHNNILRWAVLITPAEFGPDQPSPPLPLVVSPHGRGVRARTNAKMWQNLPGQGTFAVICPGGMGRRLPLHSWGYQGQIDDLVRMPAIVTAARPWLRVDPDRIYAVGGSMGGHETLLLVSRPAARLAGAVAFDSVTDFFRRYDDFAQLGAKGVALQGLARIEVGGTPTEHPRRYQLRSPDHFKQQIAASGVPLQMWWSDQDEIVTGQEFQSGKLFADLEAIGTTAVLDKVTGHWSHTAESYRDLQLPGAVRWLGLVPDV
jgi:poly(3-hydroxybutyrate) depolymerase